MTTLFPLGEVIRALADPEERPHMLWAISFLFWCAAIGFAVGVVVGRALP